MLTKLSNWLSNALVIWAAAAMLVGALITGLAGIRAPFNWLAFVATAVLVMSVVRPLVTWGWKEYRRLLGREIIFDLGDPWSRERPWFRQAVSLGGAHSATAASYGTSGTIATNAASGGYYSGPEQADANATFVYLPICNTHPALDARAAEATFEFQSVTGKTILGPWPARWMNSENPATQSPLKDSSAYDRHEIPAGSKESIDLVYYIRPGSCFVYTNESARSGVIPDQRTAIRDSEFIVRLVVRAPSATPLHATLRLSWENGQLLVKREE